MNSWSGFIARMKEANREQIGIIYFIDVALETPERSSVRRRGCVGHQNCEYGENDCYGESCTIEDVISSINAIQKNLRKRLKDGFDFVLYIVVPVCCLYDDVEIGEQK